jgi:hypothetical protein
LPGKARRIGCLRSERRCLTASIFNVRSEALMYVPRYLLSVLVSGCPGLLGGSSPLSGFQLNGEPCKCAVTNKFWRPDMTAKLLQSPSPRPVLRTIVLFLVLAPILGPSSPVPGPKLAARFRAPPASHVDVLHAQVGSAH